MHEAPRITEPSNINNLRQELLSDFLLFTRVMFEAKTGREFMMSQPIGCESHFLTLARELTDVFLLRTPRLMINIPPGWGKSEFCKSFVAWCMAHYPICKFLYISHSFELATLHTSAIKQTLNMSIYKTLFGVDIRRDSSAKDFFQTTDGGAVAAFGAQGGITGRDAGLPGLPYFSGALIIDDIHKPDEVHSDTIREKVKRNYFETIERRLRAPNVPIIIIGQRLHEDDLPAHLLDGSDGQNWKTVIIKSIDPSGNARYPEVNPLSQLKIMREKQEYVFYSQYQQEPLPAGGSLFRKEWFPLLDSTPDIIATFVTCDSAETEKEYNDATVFSFWGLYHIKFNNEIVDDLFGIHWIDCVELRIEPKDLENAFLDFWTSCMRYNVKPKFAAIEKKSTGTTLISILDKIQGLRILNIERPGHLSGRLNSKTNRYIEMQQYVANKQISLPFEGKHTDLCITHMAKITANNVHRFDDIADTCYDAVKIALIDKVISNTVVSKVDYSIVAKSITSHGRKINLLRRKAYAR